jgi:hypothetical protein
VERLFEENSLKPETRTSELGVHYTAGNIEIICGDIFGLDAGTLSACAGVYDRAALVALPAEMRQRYVEHVYGQLAGNYQGLLLTLYYNQQEMDGPPFSVGEQEAQALYAPHTLVHTLDQREILSKEPKFKERGLTALDTIVFQLSGNRSCRSPAARSACRQGAPREWCGMHAWPRPECVGQIIAGRLGVQRTRILLGQAVRKRGAHPLQRLPARRPRCDFIPPLAVYCANAHRNGRQAHTLSHGMAVQALTYLEDGAVARDGHAQLVFRPILVKPAGSHGVHEAQVDLQILAYAFWRIQQNALAVRLPGTATLQIFHQLLVAFRLFQSAAMGIQIGEEAVMRAQPRVAAAKIPVSIPDEFDRRWALLALALPVDTGTQQLARINMQRQGIITQQLINRHARQAERLDTGAARARGKPPLQEHPRHGHAYVALKTGARAPDQMRPQHAGTNFFRCERRQITIRRRPEQWAFSASLGGRLYESIHVAYPCSPICLRGHIYQDKANLRD